MAAEAHGARQLASVCKYWMAMELPQAEKHEQWGEIKEEVKKEVREEHARLLSVKSDMREVRELRTKIPCLFAPVYG